MSQKESLLLELKSLKQRITEIEHELQHGISDSSRTEDSRASQAQPTSKGTHS